MKKGSEGGWLAAYLPAAWAGHICQVGNMTRNQLRVAILSRKGVKVKVAKWC